MCGGRESIVRSGLREGCRGARDRIGGGPGNQGDVSRRFLVVRSASCASRTMTPWIVVVLRDAGLRPLLKGEGYFSRGDRHRCWDPAAASEFRAIWRPRRPLRGGPLPIP